MKNTVCSSLSVLTAIVSGKPRLAGYIGAKDDESCGDIRDNWRSKMCKALVK